MLDGSSIKAAREAKGMTQADIAQALDVTPQAVSGWERGEASPDQRKVPALSGLLLSVEISPVQVLRTILCANPTAEQIIAALDANGLEITKKNAGYLLDMEEMSLTPVRYPSVIDDPVGFVREIISRRDISASRLAESCGISPSTLNRALNDPNHTCILSARTLRKIKQWDQSNTTPEG